MSATAVAPGLEPHLVEGLPALRLSAGPLEATFVPRAGMLGASLKHEGEELLDVREGVRGYAATGATTGIPFLHPWANRLADERYAVAGREVAVPRDVPRDPLGLPIHGLLPRQWRVSSAVADRERTGFVAVCDFRDAAFPFPHRVEQRVALDARGLVIQTVLHATGSARVPVAFGFHPYLRLPGVPRAAWEVALPARRRLLTDDRLIPTGATLAEAPKRAPLGRRVLDHGYDGLGPRPRFALAGGGRRIEVTFLAGYPFAQVYAPAGHDVVCFEPMTAPTNALIAGAGLRLVDPGERFGAAFRIGVG